jgi:K+-transporting ATPase ATPase B chain
MFARRGVRRKIAAAKFVVIPFSAQTRMSGVDMDGREIRKGAPESGLQFCANHGSGASAELQVCIRGIANAGGTPLLVSENGRVLGAIALTDIVKGGMRERFDQLRTMGIRTMKPEDLRVLIQKHTKGRDLGFLGEPRANVLELNLELDSLHSSH